MLPDCARHKDAHEDVYRSYSYCSQDLQQDISGGLRASITVHGLISLDSSSTGQSTMVDAALA
jgi:hypothetical protein